MRLATDDFPARSRCSRRRSVIADATRDVEPGTEARTGLARAYLVTNNPNAALPVARAAAQVNYPAQQPTVRLLEGVALLGMERLDEAMPALSAAVAAADEQLSKAATNVDALNVRGLALSALALIDEPHLAAEAIDSFRQARTVTTAAGIITDVTQLFDVLAERDKTEALASVRQAIKDG